MDDIDASIRYVVAGEKSVFYASEREKSYWPADDHVMRVRNMRAIAGERSLERQGFILLRHDTAVRNFYDPREVKDVYYPEVISLVKRLAGASLVIAFGDVARSDDPAMRHGRLPAFGAHVDYGRVTVEQFARDILGEEEAARWLSRRVVLINVWRPITPVYRCPLALCDASSVAEADLNDSEIRGGLDDPNRPSMWGYNLSYNPGHRWYYVPRMQPDELLAFKLYDSDRSRVQWTGHTAIADPTSPADAPARESIEIRTISFIE